MTTTVVGNGTLSISPDLPIYDYGTSVALNATPDVGWAFDSWSGSLERVGPWWDLNRPYRIALSIEANGVARQDKVAETIIDFTAIFTQLGVSDTFDEDSIHVAQIDADGSILDVDVPFQFDKDAAYDASTNASGNLILLMKDEMAAEESRLYHVYFGPTGSSYSTPSFTNLITSTLSGISDEGEESYQFETERATYFYHVNSGGFSSLNDSDGNDWISYDDNVSGSGGAFRGIPNLIYRGSVMPGGFHPGLGGSGSTVLNSGPLKTTYRTKDGNWEALWEIYPDVVRMTLVEAEHNYWFLYEGTPGGALDSDDFLVTSDGTQYTFNTSWTQDMPNDEWIYFADPDVGTDGRSLFLVHHEGDSITDSYRRMSDPNGSMTVFGFGRDNLTTGMSATPQKFTFGLIDESAYSNAKPLIEAAYKELAIFVSEAEKVSDIGSYDQSNGGSLTVAMNMNRAITATFVPEYYALETFTVGDGAIELSMPNNPQGYSYGEVVTATAIPSVGWYFDSWSGPSTNVAISQVVTLTSDAAITATFLASQYELNLVQPATGGAIAVDPASTTYAYNTPVTLSATPAQGYVFGEWQGDVLSGESTLSINITENMTVTALFDIASYGVETNVVGQGQIELLPQQADYIHGSTIDVVATPADGWYFTGWSGGLAGANPSETLTILQPQVITATFEPNQFTLSANSIGAGNVEISPNQDTYAYGSIVSVAATPAEHWAFVSWAGLPAEAGATATFTVTDNHEFTATFAPIKYTLSVLSQGNGNVVVEPDKASYLVGEKVTLTAEPAEQWILAQWSGDYTGDSLTETVEITGDMTIRALFEEAFTEVKTEVLGEGMVRILPEQSTYEQGKPVTLIASAEPGWRFVQWNDGDKLSEKTVEVRSGQTYTATFEQERYTLSVNVIGNGNITRSNPEALTYTYGEKVVLTASPDEGWFFAGWQGTFAGSQSPAEITIVGDVVMTATFTTSPYTLITNVNGLGNIVIEPGQPTYSLNEQVILKAIADTGWVFSGWSNDLSGVDPTAQLTITRNHSVTANFVETAGPLNVYLPLISISQ